MSIARRAPRTAPTRASCQRLSDAPGGSSHATTQHSPRRLGGDPASGGRRFAAAERLRRPVIDRPVIGWPFLNIKLDVNLKWPGIERRGGEGYTVGSSDSRGVFDGRQWPTGSLIDRSSVMGERRGER